VGLSLVTAPAEPLTTAEAKAHLRVTHNDDDAYIYSLISAARHAVEAETNRALMTQTWDWTLDMFSGNGHLEVPKAPLISVTHVKYVDTAGVEQTWATSNYTVQTYAGPRAEPGRIALGYSLAWPVFRSELGAVRIRFVAGYGNAMQVPGPLLEAVRQLIATWYEQRASVSTVAVSEMPHGLQFLTGPFKVLRW